MEMSASKHMASILRDEPLPVLGMSEVLMEDSLTEQMGIAHMDAAWKEQVKCV